MTPSPQLFTKLGFFLPIHNSLSLRALLLCILSASVTPAPIPNPHNPSKLIQRDAQGRFVKNSLPKLTLTSSATPPPSTTPSEPLFQFKINNPFTRILSWIDYLRRHHSTTLVFRLTIPLIALPVIIYSAYRIGVNSTPTQIKYLFAPTPTSTPLHISKLGTLRLISAPSLARFYLVLGDDTLIPLIITDSYGINSLINKRVLVTGTIHPPQDTITVASISDFEILPPSNP